VKSFIEIASGLCPLQRQTASDCHEPIPSALAMTKRGSHCEERDSFVCHCEERDSFVCHCEERDSFVCHCEERDSFVCHCEERDSFVCHCEECNDEAISLLMKIFVGTQCDLLCRFAFATIL